MFGGLLAVYAMLASRVICDAMWEAVRYDHTVAVAREVTFVVKLIGSAAEVLGLTLIVLAAFAGRNRGKPPAANQSTSIASP